MGSTAVTWSSKKQEITTLSITEAEYISVTSLACQPVWLRRLLSNIREEQKNAITEIYCENRSAIALTKNPIQHGRTKHIDIRFHFIRSLFTECSISLRYRNIEDQMADILTKSLPTQKFRYLRMMLGVCSFELQGDVRNN